MKILVRREGQIKELEGDYASELELQTFLCDYPELIPVGDIEPNLPALMCIGFEIGIAAGAGDLLYIDADGRLTVVETKLKKSREARREVIGQILEYASVIRQWRWTRLEEIAHKLFTGKHCPEIYKDGRATLTLEIALSKFLPGGGVTTAQDYRAFKQSVDMRLRTGDIRLLICIDEAPEALQKTVEFVNSFSRGCSMYLLQLRKFQDGAEELFVPAVFGRVPPSLMRSWDANEFFEQVRQNLPESERPLQKLLALALAGGEVRWGHGKRYGTFRYYVYGREMPLFVAYTDGRLEFDFATMSKSLPPDAVERYRGELRSSGVIPEDVLTSNTWRHVKASSLSEEQIAALMRSITRFEQSLEPVVDRDVSVVRDH